MTHSTQHEINSVFENPYVKEIHFTSTCSRVGSFCKINVSTKKPNIKKLVLENFYIYDFDMFPNLTHIVLKKCNIMINKPINPNISFVIDRFLTYNEYLKDNVIDVIEFHNYVELAKYDFYRYKKLKALNYAISLTHIEEQKFELLYIHKMSEIFNMPINIDNKHWMNHTDNYLGQLLDVVSKFKTLRSISLSLVEPKTQQDVDRLIFLDKLKCSDGYEKFHVNNLNISHLQTFSILDRCITKLKNNNVLYVTVIAYIVEYDNKSSKIIKKMFAQNKNILWINYCGNIIYNNKYIDLIGGFKHLRVTEYSISTDLTVMKNSIYPDVVKYIIDEYI
jgi:hypothetical protein